jgi:L-iditol 2-dehydrogenase
MRALQLTDYKRLEMVDLPIPDPGDDEVLIAVRACGICGSDVHGYDGSTGRRIPPLVMGHEAAGTVAAVGKSVKAFREGDRVTFDSTVYCGLCFFCERGERNLCDAREVVGVSTAQFRRMGAFAEYIVVPERIVHRLPDEMPFAHAALIEAVSVAVHAVSLSRIQLNDTVVIVGAGMIGLLTLQAALRAGAGTAIVLDLDDTRLALAQKMGATRVFNANKEGLVAEILELTQGRGADVALECVGTGPAVALAIESVRKGATVTLVGNVAPMIELGLQSIVTRQLRLQGSCASAGEYPASIALMSRGAIQVEGLLSAVAPLEEGAAWFDRLYRREPGLMKVVLRPGTAVS